MIFLVEFQYDHFCQGYERAWTKVLVRNAVDFDDACRQIKQKYRNAEYFENLTI